MQGTSPSHEASFSNSHRTNRSWNDACGLEATYLVFNYLVFVILCTGISMAVLRRSKFTSVVASEGTASTYLTPQVWKTVSKYSEKACATGRCSNFANAKHCNHRFRAMALPLPLMQARVALRLKVWAFSDSIKNRSFQFTRSMFR